MSRTKAWARATQDATRRRITAGRTIAVGLLAALSAIMAASAPAHAQWRVENQSRFILEIAIGYQEGSEIWSEGWLRVRPGESALAIEGDVPPGIYYLYARSSAVHRGGRREWSGNKPLCVDEAESSFFLSSTSVCENAGAVTQLFSAITVGGSPWNTRLVEPATPQRGISSRNVQTYGLQRLLADAGYYDTSRIDGVPGRRTDRAVSAFLSDIGEASRPPYPQLIDLLADAAARREDDRGLRLCNRSDAVVWAAMALRVDRAWESRGWWPLETEECALVVDEALDQSAYYVYADKKDERGPRPLREGEENFCIAQTRFAIPGRNNCQRRGFDEGRFIRVEPNDEGAALVEFQTQDFAEPVRIDATP